MALQTDKFEVSKNTFTLRLTVTENSTSTSGNSSSVSYKLELVSTTKDFYNYGVGAKIEIDGKVVASRNRGDASSRVNLSTYSSVTLLSGSTTIAHNNDGSKSISLAYSIDMAEASYTPGPMSGTGNMALTTIPRGATITSAPNFTDEDKPVVKFSNPAGATVEVGIKSEDESKFLVAYKSASGSSYTFTFTQSEQEALQSYSTKNTATVAFVARSVLYGQTYFSVAKKTLTIKNPAPTLSPAVEDVNPLTVALTGDAAVMVRYASNAKVTTGAKAVKQSKLVSVKVTCGSKSLSGDGTLTGVEFGSFVISATDSRGNTTTATVKKTLIEYVTPTCYIGEGAPNALGEFNFSTSGTAWNGDFGESVNLLTAEYRYRLQGGDWGEWLPMEVQTNGNTYTATVHVTGLDYTAYYEFHGRVSDKLNTAESTTKIVTSIPVFDWGKSDFNFNVPVFVTERKEDGSTDVRGFKRCGAMATMSTSVGSISSSTKIPVGSVVHSYGGATVESGGIKVANDGEYIISGAVHFTGGSNNLWCAVGVASTGKSFSGAYETLPLGAGTMLTQCVVAHLSAGDIVTLMAYPNASVSVNKDSRTTLSVAQVY